MGSRRRNFIILLLVIGLVAASVYAVAEKPVQKGIDIAGGIQLVYKASETPINPTIEPDDMDQAIEIIRERVDVLGVSEPEISKVGADQIVVNLPLIGNPQDAIDQVGQTSQLYFYDFEPNVVPPDKGVQSANERSYNRLYDAVDAAGDREPECEGCTTTGSTYYLFDEDSLELLAGPAKTESDLFLKFDGEQPEGSVVKEVPQGTIVVRAEAAQADDKATEDVDESEVGRGYYVLKDRPELSGEDIRDPKQQTDPVTGQPNVTFDFTDEGRNAFRDVTARIAQRGADRAALIQPAFCSTASAQADQLSDSFAVILDGEIVSRPIINFCENPGGIDGRTGAQISGSFSIQEAQDLAKFLRIGALPVELSLISQNTVSATLGAEALDQAIMAGLIGLGLVIIFLLFYYRFLGLVAALGLIVYALFFVAMIKIIPITLTLPGIAGLILTIGVAADSNIVIFERIKEEARHGRSMTSAISAGYRKGIATIIDANVITLLTAFILFVLATAGVKGFAFTLGIGTIVSLFTAVLFTQAILSVLGRAKFLRSPAFLGAGEQKVSWNIDFMGLSKWFFSFSGVILAIGAIAFATTQLNFGIDFESGTRISVGLDQEASVDDIRATLSDAGISGTDSAEIQAITDDDTLGANAVQINADFSPEDAAKVREALDAEYGVPEDAFQNTSIGPTFGAEIARNALRAIILSLLVICIYVAIRFEAKYAVPVLIALVHDVLITAGVYAVLGAEVTSATVAAFLTILGYSMYDTIIVFDRIRENVPRMPRAAFSQIVNRSMSEVLTRSLITGLSTVFLIGVLLVLGGDTLQDFALAMMIGVLSGTYSSIFIASPVLSAWKEREPQYRARRHFIEEHMGYVPAFPEDNTVARLGDGHDGEDLDAEPELEPEPAPVGAAAAPQPIDGDGDGDGGVPEAPASPVATPSAPGAPAPTPRPDRNRPRRRKHGRSR